MEFTLVKFPFRNYHYIAEITKFNKVPNPLTMVQIDLKWSSTVRTITAFVAMLLTGTIAFLFERSINALQLGEPTWQLVIVLVVILVLAASIVIPILLYPKKYVLTDTALTVKRNYKDRVIPIQEIRTVYDLADRDDTSWVRTFGVGGFLGYFGYFEESKLGSVYLEAANTDHLIIVELQTGQKIGLSDSKDGQLMKALNARL